MSRDQTFRPSLDGVVIPKKITPDMSAKTLRDLALVLHRRQRNLNKEVSDPRAAAVVVRADAIWKLTDPKEKDATLSYFLREPKRGEATEVAAYRLRAQAMIDKIYEYQKAPDEATRQALYVDIKSKYDGMQTLAEAICITNTASSDAASLVLIADAAFNTVNRAYVKDPLNDGNLVGPISTGTRATRGD